MPDFASLVPSLKRVDGTPLTERDLAKLRDFYGQFLNESAMELERKPGVMRERIREHEHVREALEQHARFAEGMGDPAYASGIMVSRPDWSNPHLDQAKFDLLTAIIQDRNTPKRGFWWKVKEYGFIATVGAAIARIFT